MPDDALLADARRALTICNACRYCEGVCAVFPALELRPTFSDRDIAYLANLCHDCRACYYVCPFSPPHEFDLNFPLVMGRVRDATYAELAQPLAVARRVDRSWSATILVSATSVAVLLAAALALSGVEALTSAHIGPRSFYEVLPWAAMVIPAVLLALVAVGVIGFGAIRFWRLSSDQGRPRTIAAVAMAAWDAVTLRNMRGAECSYPGERHSSARWAFHTLLLFGYAAALVSTTIAAIAAEILGIEPPYPLLSAPVVSGSVGGVAMMIGSIGLIALKIQSHRELSHGTMRTMDLALLISTLLVSSTGMLVLAFRETAAMPILLVVHLGFVGALFLTAPYGKLVHGVYRYIALVRDRVERE